MTSGASPGYLHPLGTGCMGKQVDYRSVRLIPLRWARDTYFDSITVDSDDGRLAGIGYDQQINLDPIDRFSYRNALHG